MKDWKITGLGTKIRRLLLATDGELQALYDTHSIAFRPRFYPIVQLLLRQGTAGVVEIAKEVGVSQPAITQTLNEMRRADLVDLKPGADRRSREVALSDQGRKVAQDLSTFWSATARAASKLDAELGMDLEGTIDRALSGLERRSFARRVLDEMGRETPE